MKKVIIALFLMLAALPPVFSMTEDLAAKARYLTYNCLYECRGDRHPVAIVAHRGYWMAPGLNKAKNSVAALREAQAFGCWGSEFDVHLTADSIVVVNHDPIREGKVIQTKAYRELRNLSLSNGEPLPTLCEYLAQGVASEKTRLVLELKPQYSRKREDILIEKAFAALRLYNLFDPERVTFISFSHYICQRLAELAPSFNNQYLKGDIPPEQLHQEGINGIDYKYKVLYRHPEWVSEAHRCGMSVNVWTVNKEEDIRRMIEMGVDFITTDNPPLVRQILGDMELLPPEVPSF